MNEQKIICFVRPSFSRDHETWSDTAQPTFRNTDHPFLVWWVLTSINWVHSSIPFLFLQWQHSHCCVGNSPGPHPKPSDPGKARRKGACQCEYDGRAWRGHATVGTEAGWQLWSLKSPIAAQKRGHDLFPEVLYYTWRTQRKCFLAGLEPNFRVFWDFHLCLCFSSLLRFIPGNLISKLESWAQVSMHCTNAFGETPRVWDLITGW